MKDFLTSLGINSDLGGFNLGTVTLERLAAAAITLVICLIGLRIVMSVSRRLLQKAKIDDRPRKCALAAIRAVLWVMVVIIVADQLGIPVTSLVALFSVLSLAVSLAVQKVLANIAGGIVILLTKPFQEGDYIETASGAGTVTDINLNNTCLETFDGLRVVVPNSVLSADKIINYTALGKRRVVITVTASYDAPTQTVRQACLSAVAATDKILPDPAPEMVVSNYGDSSIEYKVRVWCKAQDYGDVLFPLTEHIRTAFEEYGVEMTYNHLNVHILDSKA